MINHDGLSRRSVLALSASIAGAAASETALAADVQPATFVLVHGAWRGGWCYERVAKRLRAKGHVVYTPTLTGLGDRSHLMSGNINLDTHLADVLNLIKWEQLDNIVLVGHSYGGAVVTGVADRIPKKIRSLVYIDAFLPGDNQSVYDLVPPQGVKPQWDGASMSNGFGIPPIPAAFFGDNAKDCAWIDAMSTPHPIATQNQKLHLTGGLEFISKKTYIHATGFDNVVFRPFYDKVKGDPAWVVETDKCGHDIMIDMPDALAEQLQRAAA